MRYLPVLLLVFVTAYGCQLAEPIIPGIGQSGSDNQKTLTYKKVVENLKQLPFNEVKWWHKFEGEHITRITLLADHIFLETDKNTLICVDRFSGVQKWRYPIPMDEPLRFEPVVAYKVIARREYLEKEFDKIQSQIEKERALEKPDYKKLKALQTQRTKITGELDELVKADYAYLISSSNFLYCLDRLTGKLIWSKKLRFAPSSKPFATKDLLFYSSIDVHRVFALDIVKDGEIHKDYSSRLRPGEKVIVADNSITVPPVSDGRRVFFVSHNGRAYCFGIDAKSPSWVYQTEQSIRCQPILHTHRYEVVTGEEEEEKKVRKYTHKLIMFGGLDHAFYALYADTGDIAWKYETGSPIKTTPVVVKDIVYVKTEGDELLALEVYPVHRKPTGEIEGEWRSGKLRWSVKDGKKIVFVQNNLVYVAKKDSEVVAVDEKTGKIKYRYKPKLIREYIPNLEDNKYFYIMAKGEYIFCLQRSERE